MTGRQKSKFFEADIWWQHQFKFKAELDGYHKIEIDELEPHGTDSAPNPADYLLLAIGGCLSSSLIFSIIKFDISLKKMHAKVRGKYTRVNERVRIEKVDVVLNVEPSTENDLEEMREWCIYVFRNFCIISESIRKGLPIGVTLKIGDEEIEIPPPK
ncbi:MAG: OsmC family protein [Candidatus Jordarchaeum sp.]|uniref:OsmC family protein n=1 Tax=Candidatus Jordarchaeum sp. TaxID=2823881 RepID=UPI00404A4A88